MAAPFALTYTAPAAELPAWQSYTQSATLTTTAFWTYATLDAEGRQTLVSGAVVQTAYGTDIVQLPITVDVPYSVGGIYTNAGGTGPTVVSVLGATGDITLGASSQVLPSATATAPDATSEGTSSSETSASTASGTTSAVTSATSPSASASSVTVTNASSEAITSSLPSTSTLSTPSSSSTSASATSAPSSLASSPTSLPPSSTSSSSPTGAASHSSASHLSGGQIAGIVLGILAFLLLLILLLLFALRRRRRQLKRDSSGRSHEWDFTPAANSTFNTRRRSSAATGGSRGGLWGLAGLVGIGSSAGGSPSTGGGEKTEKYGDIGTVREVREDGEGFEGMAMMDESASPASIFPTIRGRGVEYAAVGGAAGAVAAGRSASGGTRASGEQGGLLDPFQEREVEEEEGDEDDEFRDEERDYHTPVMPSGWAGAAAATGLLHGVGETWSGTPSTQASPSRGDRPSRVYPSFRISGTSTPPESPPPPIRRNRRGVPVLSEFAWMRGRSEGLGGTASTDGSGSGSGSGRTRATRSSVSGTTNSGSGSRSAGATGSSGLEPGGSENRHSRGSRGTSMNDASPNVSELFYNTPRWLGTRQPSSSSLGSPGSHYPDPPPDTPLMYPLAFTNSDPMRAPPRRSREASDESAGSMREMRHRTSEGMLDRIAASFGMALSGLGIRQGRSRETSHESEQSGGSGVRDRFTDTPPRITPRVASQPSTTGTPSLAPLRRSITTATFGQPTLGLPRPSSSSSSSDLEQARSLEHYDSFEQDFTPPKAGAAGRGAPKGEENRLTATSFGTLGQHIDSNPRSPSPSEVLSEGDLGATTLGSHSHSNSHSHSGSGSQSHSHGHGQFSSSEHEPSSQGSEAHSRLGSGGAPPAYDRRRNTLGRQVTVSEAGSGSGSGSGRSRSMRTAESSEGSSGNHSSGASHAHSSSSGVPPPIPESETVRQGLGDR